MLKKLAVATGLAGAAWGMSQEPVLALDSCENEYDVCTAQLGEFWIVSCSQTTHDCAFLCHDTSNGDYDGTCQGC